VIVDRIVVVECTDQRKIASVATAAIARDQVLESNAVEQIIRHCLSLRALTGDASTRGFDASVKALVDLATGRFGANALLPGFVPTPERRDVMPSEIQKQALAQGRSPGLGEVEDIAAMVALLASKDGEWINGQTIAVDGGSCMS
jgi:hypothetical protein